MPTPDSSCPGPVPPSAPGVPSLPDPTAARGGGQSFYWRPLDPAPKDGYDILVSIAHAVPRFYPTRIAFWDEARGGIWSVWPGRDPINPTHWMPLPEPPHAA